ncbi:MAG: GAF domain-containing protein, partial [Salinivirgaceae bacterium]|nr:GAF domain-containing protein [Salinivirgaceae bacterium]
VARFKNIDYNILLAILIGIIINIFLLYRIGKKIYKNSVTKIKTIKEKYKPENITIDQVINQEKETSEEQSQQNKNHFDSLIEQFAQCADAVELSKTFLSRIAKELEIVQGLIYKYSKETEHFEPIADYAFYGQEQPSPFKIGEGLNGQVARDTKTMVVEDLPRNYRKIVSGLGHREPKYLLIIPIISNNHTIAIAELALFNKIEPTALRQLEKILNNLSNHFEK